MVDSVFARWPRRFAAAFFFIAALASGYIAITGKSLDSPAPATAIPADYQRAVDLFKAKKYDEAVKLLKPMADDEQFRGAEYVLGLILVDTSYPGHDVPLGKSYLERAAAKGLVAAADKLATLK